LSYVDDVLFSNISEKALWLNGQYAQNSGPYSNLTMSNVGTCVSINGIITDTRGVHGLNCSTTASSPAAIYIDGPNNSLEDISLTGMNTTYGILIGDSAGSPDNVLFNISGSGFSNLIYVSNVASGSNACPEGNNATSYNACDITIMNVTNGTTNSNTINDQVGGIALTDAHLGMYVLGEPVQYGSNGQTNNNFLGNSHFTTSPHWPTWIVGSNQQQGTACPSVGSLYSVTSGSAPTLLECEQSSGGVKSWAQVK